MAKQLVTEPDRLPAPEYTAHLQGALMIMKEINRITFEQQALEWFRSQAPAVVKELKRLGVKFPKVTKV